MHRHDRDRIYRELPTSELHIQKCREIKKKFVLLVSQHKVKLPNVAIKSKQNIRNCNHFLLLSAWFSL